MMHLGDIRKLVFVGGKGGVGKTSIATSLARALADTHKTLLVSTDPAHSVVDSLDTIDQGQEISAVDLPGRDLHVWQLNAEKAFEDFKVRHDHELRQLWETSSHFDDEDIDQLIGLMIPGVDEVMGLKAIMDVFKTDEYNKIVIDMAPTGHALRLLHMPDILNGWIKVMANMRWKYRLVQKTFKGKYTPDDTDDLLLDLKRTVFQIRKALVDHDTCEFILVGRPESMVLTETRRLYHELRDRKVFMRSLIVNGLAPDSEDDFFHDRYLIQERLTLNYQEQFEDLEVIGLPLLREELKGEHALKKIEKHIISK